jgi:diaminohydroxyphosphoribosylaminopyrimidine deaminase / 5-amino-6-(5-phosphoribosylamino)uracil reductase
VSESGSRQGRSHDGSPSSLVFSEFDRAAMRRALELAERGLETTHPNPRVGCVIAQGERIVGEGWHEWPGEAHAEVMALRAAGAQAAGSTAYVTLEPCNHFGRTPPCVNALLEARVRRVVFALHDPNPTVAGGGGEALRRAGVQVESGLMEAEAAEINAGFIRRMRFGRPWVRLKIAMSLDGRTALSNGASQWITSEPARADVQLWRARSSAILTGSGTVLADDPQLNVRIPAPRRRQPARVVLDTNLRTPPTARLFASSLHIKHADAEVASRAQSRDEIGERGAIVARDSLQAGMQPAQGRASGASSQPHVPRTLSGTAQLPGSVSAPGAGDTFNSSVIIFTATSDPVRRAALEARGAHIEQIDGGPTLDLHAVMDRLGALGVNELLVEAGATLSGALIRSGLVDELLLYIAPMLLGPHARALATLPELTDLSASPRFAIIETHMIGPDVRLRLRPVPS